MPKRSREQLESESKAVVVVVSAADSMAAVQVTTTAVTTTAVVTNAAAGIGIGGGDGVGGGGGDDPTETADPMNGTTGTAAAAIETNGNGVSVSYDVIAAISQAHLTNCDYTDELTRTLLRKPVASPVSIGTVDHNDAENDRPPPRESIGWNGSAPGTSFRGGGGRARVPEGIFILIDCGRDRL